MILYELACMSEKMETISHWGKKKKKEKRELLIFKHNFLKLNSKRYLIFQPLLYVWLFEIIPHELLFQPPVCYAESHGMYCYRHILCGNEQS